MGNEKRLIYADDLLCLYNMSAIYEAGEYGLGCIDIINDIKNAPTVDAVEVVRCRDCVYWENGKDYTPFCNRPEYGFHECPKPDNFCSYGERKLND